MREPFPFARAARFSVTGVVATAVHVLIAAFLIARRDIDPAWANATASFGATVFSYLVHTWWSFSSSPRKRNLQRFAVVSIASCGLSAILAQIAAGLGWSYWFGILLVVSCVPAATFAAHQLWTYASE